LANEHTRQPLDGIFHALSDATRRSVLATLSRGPASVTDLARPFDMALPSFLKHVRLLESTGWIVTHKDGRVRTCRIRRDTLTRAQRWLHVQHGIWEARTNRLEDFVAGSTPASPRRKTTT
jgi:DNA-binding transcriptional ArsR family regulator